MVAETICRFGTEEQKRKHLPKICSGEYPAGSFALTEPTIGSDAASLKTKAVKHKDRYILNGEKIFVTSGGYSGVIIVMARTQQDIGYKGITAFLVTPDMKGLIIGPAEDKMGLRASNTVSLRFEECEVPQENILGKEGEGFKIAMSALDGGRIGVAAQALGIGWAALNAAQIYAKERIQFQRPISSFQAIQWMIADSATKLQAAQLLTYKAAYLKGEKRRYTPEAAMAKVYATEVCNQVCTKAVQIHGGYGYISEFPVERYMRDARATTIYEGTSEIQRMVIAKNVLG
jgi:alkylation response protein AidB-like acyl-CoA dehydrogenase